MYGNGILTNYLHRSQQSYSVHRWLFADCQGIEDSSNVKVNLGL